MVAFILLERRGNKMSKIIFKLDSSNVYEGLFHQIGKNQVRLIIDDGLPSETIFTSGFVLVNEYNGRIQTNRNDYVYIYRTYEDGKTIELCNDNIQYVEPEPIPEPEPYVPTEEEIAEREKQEKISSINNQINTLKSRLASTDYIFVKNYESSLVGEILEGYDFESLHTERQALRDEINALEVELSELV